MVSPGRGWVLDSSWDTTCQRPGLLYLTSNTRVHTLFLVPLLACAGTLRGSPFAFEATAVSQPPESLGTSGRTRLDQSCRRPAHFPVPLFLPASLPSSLFRLFLLWCQMSLAGEMVVRLPAHRQHLTKRKNFLARRTAPLGAQNRATSSVWWRRGSPVARRRPS